jgi:hypothetical protein
MNTTAVLTALSRTTADASRVSPPGRWVSVAAAGYITSWIVGLVLTPAAPAPNASAADVHAYYTDHAAGVVTSSVFVHGTAGVALALFAVAAARATAVGGGLRRAVIGTGMVAAVLSLGQVVIAGIAAAGVTAGTAHSLFHALNLVDVVKIAVLAAFVAAATTAARAAGTAPGWLRTLAAVLVPLLLVTSTAFLIDSAALMHGLAAALILLLVWAGATGLLIGRNTAR